MFAVSNTTTTSYLDLAQVSEQLPAVVGICEATGAVRRVPVTTLAAERFERSLQQVAANVADWSGDDLQALCASLCPWDVAECERTLALLASHGSAEAFECIAELRPELAPELKEFAELAFATALGWLGFDYERAWDDTAPSVQPSCPADNHACSSAA